MAMKYIGVVRDRHGDMRTRKTRSYNTYEQAQHAAEALCEKTMGSNGEITVEEKQGPGRPPLFREKTTPETIRIPVDVWNRIPEPKRVNAALAITEKYRTRD